MKTKNFFMVLVALFMGSQMAIFAQGKKEGKTDRKQFGQEQMQKMQCNQLINALALDDAETAKFKPVYTKYMEEMRAVRDMNPRAPRSTLTDAEVEQVIKARFAQSRKMLDIREKYYNEFRKFLSPKQIQKMYNMEKNNGEKFRKEMNKRQGMRAHASKRHTDPVAPRTNKK